MHTRPRSSNTNMERNNPTQRKRKTQHKPAGDRQHKPSQNRYNNLQHPTEQHSLPYADTHDDTTIQPEPEIVIPPNNGKRLVLKGEQTKQPKEIASKRKREQGRKPTAERDNKDVGGDQQAKTAGTKQKHQQAIKNAQKIDR